MQRAYWEAFQAVLNRHGGPLLGNRKPQPRPWMNFPIGRGGFQLNSVMAPTKKQVRAELYILRDSAKVFFALLHGEKDAVERELGYPLKWEELPGRDQRIASYLKDVDPKDKWPRQHGIADDAPQRHAPRLCSTCRGARCRCLAARKRDERNR